MHQAKASTDAGIGAARRVRLVLASRSARRRLLLAEAGIEHEAIDPSVDDGELSPGRVGPEAWVVALAWLKARAGLEALGERAGGALVLGADTVCVIEDDAGTRIIGQPRDEADAEAMIDGMQRREHGVLTGVAICGFAEGGAFVRTVFVDRASVRVGEIGRERIGRYVDSGGWRGKAGGYNLTERLAEGWPIEFEGDPGAIVGLPMRRLVPLLERLGVRTDSGGGAS